MQILGYKPGEIQKTSEWWWNQWHPDDVASTKKAVKDYLEGRAKKYSVEFRLKNKSGKYVWISSNGVVLRKDKNNKPLYMIGIHQDITERKRAEEEIQLSHRILSIAQQNKEPAPLLGQSVEQIRSFFNTEAVGIRLLDEEGNIPYQAYEGFSQEFYELESPLSIKTDECMCIYVIKGQVDSELPFITKGGSFYMNGTTAFLATVSEEDKGKTRNVCNEKGYESVALIPIRMNNQIIGLIHVADKRENMVPVEKVEVLETIAKQLGTAIQRVGAEEALRTSRDYLEKLTNSMWDAVFSVKMPERVIEWANDSFRHIGYEPSECIGRDTAFLYPDKDNFLDFGNKLKDAMAAGKNVLHTDQLLKRKSGETFPAEITVTFHRENDKVVSVVSIVRDITERKQAELELRSSREYLNRILNGMFDDLMVVDRDLRITDVNQRFLERYQGAHEEIIGRYCYEVTHHSPEPCRDLDHPCPIREVLKTGRYKSAEHRHIDSEGHELIVELSAFPLLGPSGEVEKVVEITRDVTERRRAEMMLKESRGNLLMAQSIADLGNWTWDITTDAVFWSDQFYLILGLKPQEVAPRAVRFRDTVHPDDREKERTAFKMALKSPGNIYNIEHRIVHPDGSVRVVLSKGKVTAWRGDEALFMVGTTQDITERKIQEQKLLDFQQLLQALVSQLEASEEQERMRLAAVLHDQIGPPLIFMKMELEMMQGSVVSKEMKEQLTEIIGTLPPLIQEVQELNFDLGCPTLHQFGLEAALKELLSEEIEQKHGLMTAFDSDMILGVIGKEMQTLLYRSIRELLFNAVKHAQARRVEVSITGQEDGIQICVTDDGVGFDVASLSNIMHKKGSYGLFSIQERINYMGGDMDINSRVGHGARITLRAPIIAKSPKETDDEH